MPERLLKECLGLLGVAHADFAHSQKGLRIPQGGVQIQGGPEFVPSRRVLLFSVGNYPKVSMSFGIMRIESEDLAEFLGGDFVLPGLPGLLGTLVMFLDRLPVRGLR